MAFVLIKCDSLFDTFDTVIQKYFDFRLHTYYLTYLLTSGIGDFTVITCSAAFAYWIPFGNNPYRNNERIILLTETYDNLPLVLFVLSLYYNKSNSLNIIFIPKFLFLHATEI